MERGDVREAREHLDKADEVLRHRVALHFLNERLACEEAREDVQKAITKLLPYKGGG